MTASPGREVDANLLRDAAPGSAQTRSDAQDAGRQDLRDLVEPLGGGHQIGTEGVTPRMASRWRIGVHAGYLPAHCVECRGHAQRLRMLHLNPTTGCASKVSDKIARKAPPGWEESFPITPS
jgi:hypothetical protein